MTILDFDFSDEVKNVMQNPELIENKIKARKKMVEFWFLIALVLFIGVAAIYFFINSFNFAKSINITILVLITLVLIGFYVYAFICLFTLLVFVKTVKLIKQGNKNQARKIYKIYKILKFEWNYNKNVNKN
ncbi:hypothetical protein EG856_03115 [Mycoplasmopsis phocirhinis]|uniref:Uncharacterized protein n=1 Tax=Mycoplasmopsis phocirhinis TaxID=142650 RepID=A0A4P6MU02_9BACT|nr:hypothetical protein [Mycoplasmopsis phocirhinis]QBF34887.1 hypothetical protein EG856_03115 [Mycoplasmopsis phocirhinis]